MRRGTPQGRGRSWGRGTGRRVQDGLRVTDLSQHDNVWWNITLDDRVHYPLASTGEYHATVRSETRVQGAGVDLTFQGFTDLATGRDVLVIPECRWPVVAASCENPYAQIEWGPRSGGASILFGALLVPHLALSPGEQVLLEGTPLATRVHVVKQGGAFHITPVDPGRRIAGCNILDDETVIDIATRVMRECRLRAEAGREPAPFVLVSSAGEVRIGSWSTPPPGPGRAGTERMTGVEPPGSDIRAGDEISLAEALAEARRNAKGFSAFLARHQDAVLAEAGPGGSTSGGLDGLSESRHEYTIDLMASPTQGHRVTVSRTVYESPLGQTIPPMWRIEQDEAATPPEHLRLRRREAPPGRKQRDHGRAQCRGDPWDISWATACLLSSHAGPPRHAVLLVLCSPPCRLPALYGMPRQLCRGRRPQREV